MRVIGLSLLKDNYAWVLCEEAGRRCAVVDPSEAGPLVDFLREEGLTPAWVLATHHHADHVGGVPGLLEHYPALEVLCSARDLERVPGATRAVGDGERLTLAGEPMVGMHVPGHTLGAMAWYFPESGIVFTGDTLFTGGCGRLFEGTPAQMHASLSRLAALPDRTRVYCGHEYTVRNLEFALGLDPDDAAVASRLIDVRTQRGQGVPTVPASIAVEKRTNPFLRVDERGLRRITGREDPVEVFAELRRRKDAF